MRNGVSVWPEDRSGRRNPIPKARMAPKIGNLTGGLENARANLNSVTEAQDSQELSSRIPSRTKPRNFSRTLAYESRYKVLKAVEFICREGTEMLGIYDVNDVFRWVNESQAQFALTRSISRESGLSRGAVGRIVNSGFKTNILDKSEQLDLGEGKRGIGYRLSEIGEHWLRGAHEKFGE